MIERDSSINNSYLYLNVPQSNSVAWNSLLGWALTKVSQISSTSNLSGKSMAITARSEKRCSDIVDLVQVLIRFMSEKDRSASALLIGRVHAIRRRRWMFGKVSSSHAPSANRRLFGSSFSADCHIVCHLFSSFPRDLGNGRSFSQNNMPFAASDSSWVLLTMIESTRYY